MRVKNLEFGAIASVIAMAWGCAGNQSGTVPEFPEEISLSDFREVNLEEMDIVNPSYILVTGGKIVITESGQRNRLNVFDRDMNLLYRKGGTGQGPEEFIQIFSVEPLSEEELAVYDGNIGILRAVSIRDSVSPMRTLLQGVRFRNQMTPVEEGKYLALNNTASYSYELLDGDGNLVDSLAYWPPKPEKVSDFTHHLACTGPFVLSADNKRLVKVTCGDGKLDFFVLEKGIPVHNERVGFFDMDYESIHNQGVDLPHFTDKTRRGYVDATWGKDFVLASFSEAPINDTPPITELHQYSPEGKPQRLIHLSDPTNGIAVDIDDNELYSLGENEAGESVVRIYRLP